MALAAALSRASARLLRAPAASPVPSLRIRELCGVPAAADEPSAPAGAEPWEEEILRDIDPVVGLVKDILHSGRYGDGGFLSPDDEKAVVEKLLVHHPRSEDKIGCGLDGIMIDKHPDFKKTRCLFVVRTNGDCEDFSYRKCVQAYIKEKYPSHADSFIEKHLIQNRWKFRHL